MNLYSVYDSKMEQYLPPFAAVNNSHAVRLFTDHVNDPQSAVNKHPDDYSLDFVGTMSEETGEITGKPVRIIKAKDVLEQTNSTVTAIRKGTA